MWTAIAVTVVIGAFAYLLKKNERRDRVWHQSPYIRAAYVSTRYAANGDVIARGGYTGMSGPIGDSGWVPAN